MKINAVGVSSSNLRRTISFYTLLGIRFPGFSNSSEQKHIESVPLAGSAKLMIDSNEVTRDIIGIAPKPGNHSSFAIEYENSGKVNDVAQKVVEAGFRVFKEPWDAIWGQRYAVVEDPDGYRVDLYSAL